MPTTVFINEKLALRVQRHTAIVAHSEFAHLIRHYQSNPDVFRYDVIHILEESTIFGFGINELPTLKHNLRALAQNAQLPLILRSAWVCPSPAAWSVLEAWLHERHTLDGLHTDACLVAALDEAAVVFEQDEIAAVRDMTGFRHYLSI